VVLKPPYLPDLGPCDFFFLPKLKFHLKGHHFETVDSIQKVMTDQPRALPHEDFQHCYREWEQLWQCVPSQGNYFEVDDVDFLVNLLIKHFIAPVTLLFRHTVCVMGRSSIECLIILSLITEYELQ
jgi:hypothetical protein